jgi:hypothetical protein
MAMQPVWTCSVGLPKRPAAGHTPGAKENSWTLPKISVQLRNQYVLEFSAQSQLHDGRYHALQIHLVRTHGLPPLLVSWRLGYYATSEQFWRASRSRLRRRCSGLVGPGPFARHLASPSRRHLADRASDNWRTLLQQRTAPKEITTRGD